MGQIHKLFFLLSTQLRNVQLPLITKPSCKNTSRCFIKPICKNWITESSSSLASHSWISENICSLDVKKLWMFVWHVIFSLMQTITKSVPTTTTIVTICCHHYLPFLFIIRFMSHDVVVPFFILVVVAAVNWRISSISSSTLFFFLDGEASFPFSCNNFIKSCSNIHSDIGFEFQPLLPQLTATKKIPQIATAAADPGPWPNAYHPSYFYNASTWGKFNHFVGDGLVAINTTTIAAATEEDALGNAPCKPCSYVLPPQYNRAEHCIQILSFWCIVTLWWFMHRGKGGFNELLE